MQHAIHQLPHFYHTGTTWCTTIRKSLSASKWLEPILDPEFIIWDRSEFSQECHVSEFLSFFSKNWLRNIPTLPHVFEGFGSKRPCPEVIGSVVSFTEPGDLLTSQAYQIRIFGLFLPLPNKTWDFNMFKLKFPFLFRVIFFFVRSVCQTLDQKYRRIWSVFDGHV